MYRNFLVINLFFKKGKSVLSFFCNSISISISRSMTSSFIITYGIVDNQIFNPVFLNRFLITEFLFLDVYTTIIAVYFHRVACATFSNHKGAAFSTVQPRCQKVIVFLNYIIGFPKDTPLVHDFACKV